MQVDWTGLIISLIPLPRGQAARSVDMDCFQEMIQPCLIYLHVISLVEQVALVDMDCFYVEVERRLRPDLRGPSYLVLRLPFCQRLMPLLAALQRDGGRERAAHPPRLLFCRGREERQRRGRRVERSGEWREEWRGEWRGEMREERRVERRVERQKSGEESGEWR